jgi:hypothetical protein
VGTGRDFPAIRALVLADCLAIEAARRVCVTADCRRSAALIPLKPQRQPCGQVDRQTIFSAEHRVHWLCRGPRSQFMFGFCRLAWQTLAPWGRVICLPRGLAAVAITYQGRVRPGGADGDAGFSRSGRPRSRRGASCTADGLSVARDRSDASSGSRGGSPGASGEC